MQEFRIFSSDTESNLLFSLSWDHLSICEGVLHCGNKHDDNNK